MPPILRLLVPTTIREEMIVHARGELPNECCGLLAGRVVEATAEATDRFVIRNDDASPRQYHTNARDMLDAFRAMRERELELLAIYHSHPTSSPVPSQRDLEQNTYGESVVHVIVSLANPQPELRAWSLSETGYREIELL
jgi:proteasome lid subunit RPN8/RPN11